MNHYRRYMQDTGRLVNMVYARFHYFNLDQDTHHREMMDFFVSVFKEAENRFSSEFGSIRERLVLEAEERFYQEEKLLREKLVAEGEQSASEELKYFMEIADKDLKEFSNQRLPLIRKTYEMQGVAQKFSEDWKYVLEILEYLIRERGNCEMAILHSSLVCQLEELASARARIAELEIKLATKETIERKAKFKRLSLKWMQFSGLEKVLPVLFVVWLASVIVKIFDDLLQ